MRWSCLFLSLLALPAGAQPIPPAMQEVDIQERLGEKLPPWMLFTDEEGQRVRFGDLFDGQKPLLLVLAYYRCPMLCGLVLDGVGQGISQLDLTPGQDYRLVTVSFDPEDRSVDAVRKKQSTLGAASLPPETPWPFLVGKEESIRALTEALGFHYRYDASSDQFAHAAVAFVLTPEGVISRYLYGVRFSPRDLRLALIEAGQGKTGSFLDRVLLTCFRYDPNTRRYGPYILGFMRLGALAIFLVVCAFLIPLWLRERRRRR